MSGSDHDISEILTLAENLQSADDLRLMMESLAEACDLKYYSFLFPGDVSADGEGQCRPVFFTNYPDTWREHYERKHYHLIDPVVLIGNHSRASFEWGSDVFLKQFPSRNRTVFHEGRDFGISLGMTIPVHGPGIEKSFFSISTDQRTSGLITDLSHRFQGELTLFASYIHAYFANEQGDSGLADKINCRGLTSRERECLFWTAKGRTSVEISKILHRSIPTINFHLKNATKKLGARHKHQAALEAAVKSLI